MKHDFLERLKAEGWRENADGSWSKSRVVARLCPAQHEHDPQCAVAETVSHESAGEGSVGQRIARRSHLSVRRNCRPILAVTFVAFVRRLRDDDNLTGGLKFLRDSVAHSLGIDDADPRVIWQCRQVETRGAEGTLVRIEEIVSGRPKIIKKISLQPGREGVNCLQIKGGGKRERLGSPEKPECESQAESR